MTSDEIRQLFLEFFEDRGHKVVPGISLVPHGDPTLLLTSAGMVQFKPYFLGLGKPPNSRLTSCQKCFRATDIDAVGDGKHLTFFEMLGNFSVGDYFKKETICWSWQFVTEQLKLPKERLWVTIYLDDDEAFACWRQVGVSADRILRFGEEDNFWGPAGDSGPCGPCSEIHYDMGEGIGCGRPECKPNCDCDRFSEIWNLVFTQYNQNPDGSRTSLPKPNIDTGMGLERIAAVVQGKASVYETDIFSPLMQRVCRLTGKRYGEDGGDNRAIRIVAEHTRGITFLIADGVLPSNERRGYVLRRLLRRASLFGRKLGVDKPFLSQIAEVVISQMGDIYPELVSNRDLIRQVVKDEEGKFYETLNTGLGILQDEVIPLRQDYQKTLSKLKQDVESDLKSFRPNVPTQTVVTQVITRVKGVIATDVTKVGHGFVMLGTVKSWRKAIDQLVKKLNKCIANGVVRELIEEVIHDSFEGINKSVNQISGLEVFRLYDTYGFPRELTAEIAKERGLSIDWEGFQAEMEKQREMGRVTQKFASDMLHFKEEAKVEYMPEPTEFVGYETNTAQSKILELRVQGQPKKTAAQGEGIDIILDKTPFYGEMGGQVGDSGEISCNKGKVIITDTVRSAGDMIVHRGKISGGEISVGDEVEASVDVARRLDIARNHTATHLLQAALRQILGDRVSQRGSLVESNRLRFDFSWLAAITEEQLREIQRWVNEKIRQNLPVKPRVIPYKQAIAEGAIALFEEKYGEEVRLVELGEPAISKELCGGTHVKSTGEIGLFLICGESSIGTGLRRIEAVTGRAAELLFEKHLSALQDVAKEIGSSIEKVSSKVGTLIGEREIEHKRLLLLERELSRKIAESLLKQTVQVNGVTVLTAKVPLLTMPVLREMGDILRDKLRSVVVVLATIYRGKPNFLAMVTPDLVARGLHAGDIVKQVAEVTGGGGGGKATMAEAGGKDAAKLDEALDLVKSVVAGQITSP